MPPDQSNKAIFEEALLMHASGRPGKISIAPTKPLTTQHDLALAYSPGVAAPCLAIHDDPDLAYDYTAKGNIVAVISNGTAVLGLGNLGALGAKPVMEGKAVLFKRFADIDGIDLEVNTEDVDEFVNCVRFLGAGFGGINLEDIKAPECFIIEEKLREIMDIPVFHDDQHGTAIIAAAGLLNALDLTGRRLEDATMVVNGAGAGALACIELLKKMGMKGENIVVCDTKGVIYRGREEGMNQWKSAHAIDTQARTLADALKGADVFFGLSAADVVSQDMVKSMADKPLVFAMANPDPEITPEEIRAVRDDAIICTGRSDYPNQINNVLGFPYIFRGALDVRASTINDEMKIAAANALAALAREDVPDEVAAAYSGKQLHYGTDYIIPVPFDPRLISAIPPAVAQAAMDTGVARRPIIDTENYVAELSARLDPTAASLQMIFEHVRNNPRRVVFAEGEEERAIRAASAFRNGGYGTPILIGREEAIAETMSDMGLGTDTQFEIHNTRTSEYTERYIEYLYERLQRRGFLRRDCQRMVVTNRNVFAACMVAEDDADAMITGLTRRFHVGFEDISWVIGPAPGRRAFGMSVLIARGRTVFVADTSVNETPSAEALADIAEHAAEMARQLGHEPRVALVSFSNFGNPAGAHTETLREAVALLDARGMSFEYDGEISADVALDPEMMELYPFCRLSGPANVLIMPDLHSANIAAKLIQKLGEAAVIGPVLRGLEKPVQIASMGASASDVVSLAALAAHDAIG